jgi:hypothetical protein
VSTTVTSPVRAWYGIADGASSSVLGARSGRPAGIGDEGERRTRMMVVRVTNDQPVRDALDDSHEDSCHAPSGAAGVARRS